MSIRRLFWLGAATLFSIAALVAIAAVLGGDFGDTQARILATCGIAFVCGGAVLAGLGCLDRGVIREAAWATVVIGIASFAAWTGAAWQEDAGKAYWKLAGVLGIWTLTGLIVTTLRLIASSPRLLGTVVPATWGAVGVAALLSTAMVLGEDGGPWQLVLVLLILTGLGYALTPVFQRLWADSEAPAAAERLLGTLGNIEVLAVRGEGRSVTIGSSRTRLASSEGIVLRERS